MALGKSSDDARLEVVAVAPERGIRICNFATHVLVQLVAERKSATKALAGTRIQSQMDKQSSERESGRVEKKDGDGTGAR